MRTITVPEFLTDQELVATVQQLVDNDRSNLIGLLVHLGELDERKLYLEAAKPSMFAYCVEVLRMSEGTTFKRIAAARVARRFPIILEMIATGEMHLSGLSLLAKHLTEANHLDVLARGRNKSKREIEKLTAQLCPQPDTAPFTNKQGTRCTAACGLEFHHEVPFGLGGEHRVENIRLLCKPHNLAQARQDYGAEEIEQRIRESRPPERTVDPIAFPGEGATASRSRGSRQRLIP